MAAVYGETLSKPAKTLLESKGIYVEYGTLVPMILNRDSSGPCPMEQAVEHISSPAQALPALEARLAQLRGGNRKKP